ncbi:hypothetical protein THAOC_14193, partial [Thalassiosira oceanica]
MERRAEFIQARDSRLAKVHRWHRTKFSMSSLDLLDEENNQTRGQDQSAVWCLAETIASGAVTLFDSLHQSRLIPSTWRGGTTSRLPLTAHNAGDSSRNDKAIDSLRKQELSNRLEDAECARHRPLESQVGPRLYTTSLRLHQPRLIPSTWRGGTTSRLPLPAHNAGD